MIWVQHWWQLALLLFFVGQPVALFFAYTLGIQYQRGGWWSVLEGVAVLALIIDVIANLTVLSLYLWDFPQRGEWTFSTRLERLVLQPGWRGRVALAIGRLLNRIAPPGHPHIKNAVNR